MITSVLVSSWKKRLVIEISLNEPTYALFFFALFLG